MKTSFKNVLFGILTTILIAPMTIAQTYSSDKGNNADGSEVILQGQTVSPEMISSIFDTSANPRSATIQGNVVALRQIGDYNVASVRTHTNASEINITQNGNSNTTQLDYTANTAIADIVQNGDFNTIKDFVNNPDIDISLDLVQDGDHRQFQREGANELTKSLKFRQSTPTIIVRSLN